jgi:hypothetical protein
MFLIIKIGVAGAALYIGIFVMLVSPIAWLVVREWPEDIGLLPDGAPLIPGMEPHPTIELSNTPPIPCVSRQKQWSITALARTSAFWKLGASFSMLMIGTVGVMSQLKPRFTDIGFSDLHAMLMMAGTALVGTMGKYLWGNFCDRFNPIRVGVVLAFANACGLLPALYHGSLTAVFLFILIFGFAMGGIMSTYPVIVACLYGREGFPGALRYISIFLIFQLGGYLIAGRSFDLTGSYDTAYMIFIALDILAGILLATLKLPAHVMTLPDPSQSV